MPCRRQGPDRSGSHVVESGRREKQRWFVGPSFKVEDGETWQEEYPQFGDCDGGGGSDVARPFLGCIRELEGYNFVDGSENDGIVLAEEVLSAVMLPGRESRVEVEGDGGGRIVEQDEVAADRVVRVGGEGVAPR